MHQPIDQGRCQSVVDIEQGAPFPEGSIRGQHDRSGFITSGNHLEQQIGPALVDGQITQFIEQEEVGTGIGLQGLSQQPIDLSRGQVINHIHDTHVTYAVSLFTGNVPQCG